MKKYLLLIMTMAFSGCATMQYPASTNTHSAVGQKIIYNASKKSCDQVLFGFNTDKYSEKIIKRIQDLKVRLEDEIATTAPGTRNSLQAQIKALESQLRNVDANKWLLERIKGGKVCVEVQGNDSNTGLIQYFIEDMMRSNGVSVSQDIKNADYKLAVQIKQNGYDTWLYEFIIFYQKIYMEAVVNFEYSLIDLKANKSIVTDSLEERSEFSHEYILGIGPI